MARWVKNPAAAGEEECTPGDPPGLTLPQSGAGPFLGPWAQASRGNEMHLQRQQLAAWALAAQQAHRPAGREAQKRLVTAAAAPATMGSRALGEEGMRL